MCSQSVIERDHMLILHLWLVIAYKTLTYTMFDFERLWIYHNNQSHFTNGREIHINDIGSYDWYYYNSRGMKTINYENIRFIDSYKMMNSSQEQLLADAYFDKRIFRYHESNVSICFRNNSLLTQKTQTKIIFLFLCVWSYKVFRWMSTTTLNGGMQ